MGDWCVCTSVQCTADIRCNEANRWESELDRGAYDYDYLHLSFSSGSCNVGVFVWWWWWWWWCWLAASWCKWFKLLLPDIRPVMADDTLTADATESCKLWWLCRWSLPLPLFDPKSCNRSPCESDILCSPRSIFDVSAEKEKRRNLIVFVRKNQRKLFWHTTIPSRNLCVAMRCEPNSKIVIPHHTFCVLYAPWNLNYRKKQKQKRKKKNAD